MSRLFCSNGLYLILYSHFRKLLAQMIQSQLQRPRKWHEKIQLKPYLKSSSKTRVGSMILTSRMIFETFFSSGDLEE